MPQRLRIFEPFRELDAAALDALAPALVELSLAPGEVLMRRGDAAEHMYLLLSGRLAVESPDDEGLAPLALLGAGELVGEIAVLAGGTRSATVRALEASQLLRLPRAELERVLERHPAALASFVDTVRRRLWRSQLGTHLRGLFGSPDPALLAELERDVEWITLPSGEDLFRHGDPADAAYIVMSGRLRVTDDAGRTLNEAAPGETLGEMALLADQPRSATVFAVRDSQLARIPTAAFNALIERHPGVLRRITGLLVARLWSHSAERKRDASVKTIAIVAAGPRSDTSAFSRRLADALAKYGATLHLDARGVDRALDRAGIAVAGEGDPASVRLVQWLNEQEIANRFVLYEADPHASAWSDRAARQADHVLFVADASAGPALGDLEQSMA
ncbi:MAG: cyclic nucleotide-binding domain-containing protein, partial [Myxococcota bacterium]